MSTPYILFEDYGDLKQGTFLLEFYGNTYGLVKDDELRLGVECVAVHRPTEISFRVIPKHLLGNLNDVKLEESN